MTYAHYVYITWHWASVGLLLVHHARRWPNIKPTLSQCLVLAGVCTARPAAQQTQGVEPVLVWCWASVADLVTLDIKSGFHHIKIRSLFCPQEQFNNINCIGLDTTSISSQPLWLCCWSGDISSFLFTKKLDPFSLTMRYIIKAVDRPVGTTEHFISAVVYCKCCSFERISSY